MSRDENSMGPRAISKPAARPRKSNPDAMPRARRLVAAWTAMAATIAATTATATICQTIARVRGSRQTRVAPIDTGGGVRVVEITAVAARTSRRRPSTAG